MDTLTTRGAGKPPYGCGRCDNRWGGLNTAHCGACHATFTGVVAFDRHRLGSHARGTRYCAWPPAVGLVDAGRSYSCWGQSGDDERWWENDE